MQIQSCLNDKGYNAGSADGLIGNKTRTAIQSFETDNRLPQTGTPSQGIMLKICSEKYSTSSGQSVKQAISIPSPKMQPTNTKKILSESEMTKTDIEGLQKCLKGLNLYNGEISGKINKETQSAVTELSSTARNKTTGKKIMSSDEINSSTKQACAIVLVQGKMINRLGKSTGTLHFTHPNGVRVPLSWNTTAGLTSWTIKVNVGKKLLPYLTPPKITYICKDGSSYNKKLGNFSTAPLRGVFEYLDSKACKGKKGVKTAQLAKNP